jgi:hypothetical protein
VHYLRGLRKCWVGASHLHKGWGVGNETNGWCMVCIKKRVKNGVMLVCERTNGQCELQGLMKYDESRDVGRFIPMRKEVY